MDTTIKHFRTKAGNSPCGVRRTAGVTSTTDRTHVTCETCTAKMHAAAERFTQSVPTNPDIQTRVERLEAQVDLLVRHLRW